ncbi:ribonuclease E/G, partial [Kitasatospora herbaricolor]
MVENDNTENTQVNGTEGTESGGRKRSRLFGSRKNAKKAAAVAAPQPPVTEAAPDASATPSAQQAPSGPTAPEPHEPPAAETSPEEETPVADEPRAAEDVPAAESTESTDGTESTAVSAPVVPGLPPTTLLFQAPDILPLPPLPRDDDGDDEPSTIRRRSRRRAGEENRGGSNDPANTVVKVRAPREPELITEPQKVKGSTRLEAKKQRRRDGRDAGRRRPVITEAEFLARRESVDRQMIVRSKSGRIQIGVLEDKVLVEHYVAKSQEASLIGNVYLGRVQNVLPSMEAAFVDIGRGRNAVLYSGEVDWDAAETGNQPRRIELALKPGDRVLVQVTKDPVGHKGARLTSQVSLPGRYLVYVPNGSMNGIS